MENNAQNGAPPVSEGLPGNAACMLCGSGSSSRRISKNMIFGTPFDIAFCEECGLYYFSKLPSEAFLDEYYGKEYFSEVRESRLLYQLKSLFSAMRALSQFIYIRNCAGGIEGKRILEIGSADGTFLSFFKTAGCAVRGLESSDYMIGKAREKFDIALERLNITDIDPGKERYDIIALPHVIEHLVNPVEILSHCKKLLAPGGIIFIEVPHSPLPEETPPEELSGYLETTHLYNFRLSSLSKLVSISGLETKSSGRFFYPVPGAFRSSGGFIGKTLMCGSLPGLNPLRAAPLAATMLSMFARYISKSDPLAGIPDDSDWRGLGDNIRIVAG